MLITLQLRNAAALAGYWVLLSRRLQLRLNLDFQPSSILRSRGGRFQVKQSAQFVAHWSELVSNSSTRTAVDRACDFANVSA